MTAFSAQIEAHPDDWRRSFEADGTCVFRGAVDTGGFEELSQKIENYQELAIRIRDHEPDHPDHDFMSDEALRGRIHYSRFSNYLGQSDDDLMIWAASKLKESAIVTFIAKMEETDDLYMFEPTGRYKAPTNPEACLPFHQDAIFFGGTFPIWICWMPLVACGASAPGLEVVRKRVALLAQRERKTRHFAHLEISDAYVEEHFHRYKWAPLMQPSDILFFTELTLHRTQPIAAGMDRARSSFDLRFVSAKRIADEGVPAKWQGRRYVKLRTMQACAF